MIAGLVSAITIASMSVSVIASAADLSVKISSAEVAAGEEFTLKVDLADIPAAGINGCEFGISYDSSVVTVTSVELGDLAKDVTKGEEGLPSPLEVNIEKDVVSLMYALGTIDSKLYLSGSGTFLTINGEVNDTAKAGDKSKFEIVAVDRAVTPGSTTTNADIVFGYMAEDDKITKYSPTFTPGTVTVLDGEVPTTEPIVTEDPNGGTTKVPQTSDKTQTDVTTNNGKPSTDVTTNGGNDKPTEKTTAKTTEDKPDVTIDLPEGTLYGDVNLDQRVNISDVVALNLYLLNADENPLELKALANADCQKNKVINTSDSTVLMSAVAEIVPLTSLGK